MTEAQIFEVKRTWKLFRGIDPMIIADTFYSKLFADHPRLRSMFPQDMKEQYRKLMDMMNTIVTRLDRIDSLSTDITAMAERHINYGVKPEHYKAVGDALLWTLKTGLGSDWTPAVQDGWISCYKKLSNAMISVYVK